FERAAATDRRTTPSPLERSCLQKSLSLLRMGLTFVLLVLARENALQGDDEEQDKVRRHILVRLVAPGRSKVGGVHRAVRGRVVRPGVLRPQIPDGRPLIRYLSIADWNVVVRRELADVQRVRSLAALFAEHDSVAYVHRTSALQVWQRKVYPSV